MLKAREILRLKHEVGLSLREIGQACNCGKSTVSEVLMRAEKAEIKWPVDFTDKQLLSMLYPPNENKSSPPEPDMEYVFYEMKKKNVTLMLLWEEYKELHPDGIMYTQFCDRYKSFKKNNQIEMHKEHKAGEEVEVDWAGSTMSYVDQDTGEIKTAWLVFCIDELNGGKQMDELNYTELSNEIEKKLQSEETIVLATCANNRVTARMMCHINDGLTILFSTSKNSEKAEQIRQNPNIALAIGNLKIEAIAEHFGHPSGHSFFLKEYPKKFPHLGAIYPEKPDDLLIVAKPTKISLFKYVGKPCEDVLEVEMKHAYRIELN